jgi:N-acetylmuramoyl-L-alanine amidase
VKFANFQVLRETVDYSPSFLLELGFLSNWDEKKYLANSKNITLLSNIIFVSMTKQLSNEKNISKNLK